MIDHDEELRAQRLAAQPIGALAQYREEMRVGVKPSQALTHAACLEIAGVEARASGLPMTGGEYFLRAAAVIVDAIASAPRAAA